MFKIQRAIILKYLHDKLYNLFQMKNLKSITQKYCIELL